MYMYIDYGWRTALWSGRSTVILLAEGIWGKIYIVLVSEILVE